MPNSHRFCLRLPVADITAWASRYGYPRTEKHLTQEVPQVREQGHLSKSQLRAIATWKAPRSAGQIEKNSDEFVEAITGFCMSADDERCRIAPLTLLHGVSWPTASVILHLYHPDRYPILDFRALWSLGVDEPLRQNFELWWAYTKFCRQLASENNVSMRILDRALWQFSKAEQRSS